MAGPVYNAVWLFLCTLHPAYSSFKAVKNKNVKEYVRWMMYWIVFALFSAIESILDPLLTFWLPFYCEVKVVFLLYLASPITRGSGVIYRRWVHPLLCSKEEEIDLVLEKVQEQGYNTGKTWIQKGVQWLGGMLITTAIRGGGGLVQQLRRSYSIMDMRDRDWGQDRFTDVTDQMDQGHFSPLSTPSMRRREILPSKTYPDRERIRGEKIFQPGHVLSTESISSGYNTDQFAPVDTDTMDTQDYELWERRRPVTDPSHEDSPGIGRNRKIMRSRAQVHKSSFSDDEEETFFESFQTPYSKPLPKLSQAFQIQSPDSSCYPSDGESTTGEYTDDDDHTVYGDILDNAEVIGGSNALTTPFHGISQNNDRDKTLTREKEKSISTKDLQLPAKTGNINEPAFNDEKGPTAPKRKQANDLIRDAAGKVESSPHPDVLDNNPNDLHQYDEDTVESKGKDKIQSEGKRKFKDNSIDNTDDDNHAENGDNYQNTGTGSGMLLSMKESVNSNININIKDTQIEEEENIKCQEDVIGSVNYSHMSNNNPFEESLDLVESFIEIKENINDEDNLGLQTSEKIIQESLKSRKETLEANLREKEEQKAEDNCDIDISGELNDHKVFIVENKASVRDERVIPGFNLSQIKKENTWNQEREENTGNIQQAIFEDYEDNQILNIKKECSNMNKDKGKEINLEDNVTDEHMDIIESSSTEVLSLNENYIELGLKKPKSTKKVKAPQPPILPSSLSCNSLVGPTENIVHLSPNTCRKEAIGSGEIVLTGSSLDIPNNNKDEDDGRVLYQSPGYPSLSTNSWQPIKEKSPPFSTTRIITHSPNTGLTRIRKYQYNEEDIQGTTIPPPITPTPVSTPTPTTPVFTPTGTTPPTLSPRTEYLGTTSTNKCPHCTIHSWLPHSPGCKNK